MILGDKIAMNTFMMKYHIVLYSKSSSLYIIMT